jgi:phosphate transport system protein
MMLGNYKKILEKSRSRVQELADDVLKACEIAFEAFKEEDIEKAAYAKEMLKDAHEKNSKIDNEIIKTLALFSPEAKDLRVVIAYLKIASELTRIADYIKSYTKSYKMQVSGEFDLDDLKQDTISFQQSTVKSLQAAVESIKLESVDGLETLYAQVNVQESKCDDILSILEKTALGQICINPENAGDFVIFLRSMRKLERVSDRSVNIVKLAYFAKKGGKLKL